jgi:hypothetical protein
MVGGIEGEPVQGTLPGVRVPAGGGMFLECEKSLLHLTCRAVCVYNDDGFDFLGHD